jgi:hypothetical protein
MGGSWCLSITADMEEADARSMANAAISRARYEAKGSFIALGVRGNVQSVIDRAK